MSLLNLKLRKRAGQLFDSMVDSSPIRFALTTRTVACISCSWRERTLCRITSTRFPLVFETHFRKLRPRTSYEKSNSETDDDCSHILPREFQRFQLCQLQIAISTNLQIHSQPAISALASRLSDNDESIDERFGQCQGLEA
jgi:hypothetical protein